MAGVKLTAAIIAAEIRFMATPVKTVVFDTLRFIQVPLLLPLPKQPKRARNPTQRAAILHTARRTKNVPAGGLIH